MLKKRQSLVGHRDKVEVEWQRGKEHTLHFDLSIVLEATAKAPDGK